MKTLIAYASRYGCTEKCANLIAQRLSGQVDLLDLKKTKKVDLSKYSKVIIGGSIYIGKNHKELTEFCAENLNALKNKKLGLFINNIRQGEEAETELRDSYPEELFSLAVAKDHFGGEMVYKKMSFMDRLVTKMVSKAAGEDFPKLDENMNASTLSEEKILKFAEVMNRA